jgi:hypothetical protein
MPFLLLPRGIHYVGSVPKSNKTPFRFRPPGAGRRRPRNVSPSDTGPYGALLPLDEALPEEFDLEGWDSNDDRDNRGPETCLSPSPVMMVRRKRKGVGNLLTRPSLSCSHTSDLGLLTRRTLGAPKDGGGELGCGGNSREQRASVSPPPVPLSPGRGRGEDGPTPTRSSSPSSLGSDFGPFSAMRPLDQANSQELAGEGWDSDADWDYRGPEPCGSSPPAPLEGGLSAARTSSPSSFGSDFVPFSAMRPLDGAHPRELAWEGWDSDADWDYGGPETCCPSPPAHREARARQPREVGRKHRSPMEEGGRTPSKRGRRHAPGPYEAPSRRSNRLRRLEATRVTPGSSSDSQRLGVGDDAKMEGVRGIAGSIDARTPRFG